MHLKGTTIGHTHFIITLKRLDRPLGQLRTTYKVWLFLTCPVTHRSNTLDPFTEQSHSSSLSQILSTRSHSQRQHNVTHQHVDRCCKSCGTSYHGSATR